MASSMSKRSGRCRYGSNARWPGNISRSSHVTSFRHYLATAGRRAGSPRHRDGGVGREGGGADFVGLT